MEKDERVEEVEEEEEDSDGLCDTVQGKTRPLPERRSRRLKSAEVITGGRGHT